MDVTTSGIAVLSADGSVAEALRSRLGPDAVRSGIAAELTEWFADGRSWVVFADLDQLHVLAPIRSRPSARRAVWIAILADDDLVRVEEALRCGADDVVTVARIAPRLPVVLARASVRARHLDRADALLHGLLVADRRATLGDIAVAVAHDLNDPLSVVALNLDLLSSELMGTGLDLERIDSARERMERAEEAIRRVNALVKEITAYAGTPSDRLSSESADPNQAVEQALVIAGGFLQGRARVMRSYGARVRAAADPGRLVQVLVDLLVNAAHALPESRAGVNEVTVRTSEERGGVVLSVEDSGVGIDPADLERIFDPTFSTRDSSGLGLWIARTLVEQVGGRIEVTSERGRGSTFKVTLPVAGPTLSVAVATRILLVEDEPMLRGALVAGLPKDWIVVEAADGRQGRSQLFEQPWDCVICDVMLPDVSSERLWSAALERDPELARRFVFVTGGAYTPEARRFVERVPNVVLEKPFRMGELRRIIDGVLSHARFANEGRSG
jgi:signal transduction histidine kinase/CheY-like chemotaxis protein